MSEPNVIGKFVNMRIPLEYVKVYVHLLAALSDYGEEVLKDCKASCNDRNSGIVECFNMFYAAISAYELGDIHKAEIFFNYVDSTLNLKYKDVEVPASISFPVEEENVTVYFDFNNPPYFELIEGIQIPLDSLEIQGDTNVVGIWEQYICHYVPANTTQRRISWEIIEGSEYAIIDSNTGKLYVKSNAYNSRVVIKVTSLDNEEINAFKTIRCTYYNQGTGDIDLQYDDIIVEYGSNKSITATVLNYETIPIRLELYQVDEFDNITLINSARNTLSTTFTVTVRGICRYFVKAIFEDGSEVISEIIELYGVACCYIGEALPNVGYIAVLNNPDYKLSPILDIGSPIGNEYPVDVTRDGNYIFIIVPRISGHMNVNEVRLDETNLSQGFEFDIDYSQQDIQINGVTYGVYGLKLNNNGFVHGNYRLLITS